MVTEETSKVDWGFELAELFQLAVQFYREKQEKAVQLSYEDKLKLVAYMKQSKNGPYNLSACPDVGLLDVVGNDRKIAWRSLKDMPKNTAMSEFINLLHAKCPLFKAYVEAYRVDKEDRERRREHQLAQQMMFGGGGNQQISIPDQNIIEQQIRFALNQQTLPHFRQYAEQQFPGDLQQQTELIAQLQEQHFQQYIQQVYEQQLKDMQAVTATNGPSPQQLSNEPHPVSQQTSVNAQQQALPSPSSNATENGADESPAKRRTTSGSSDNPYDGLPPIAAASMWTRKDIEAFKESLKSDKESVLKVGSGETVTVRVPTHEDGTCIFWEFATDTYDIGFGIFFEWTHSDSNMVSVHVTDSSEDEDEAEAPSSPTEEKDKEDDTAKVQKKPPLDEVIPIYRRDSHLEVYCGNHVYPGKGVYLLKFDNSYSLWRSKTLYYRVYYTK